MKTIKLPAIVLSYILLSFLFFNVVSLKAQTSNRPLANADVQSPDIHNVLFQKSQKAFSAQETISGTVKNASNNNPLIGVNIFVKGTNRGTFTDKKGHYKLSVSSISDTLVFSYVGFKEKSVPIRGHHTLNVALEQNQQSLNQMVVVAYGEKKKDNLVESISTVDNERLNQSPAINLGNSLAGKVTGLQLTQVSGLPGGYDPNLFIRGVHSLTQGGSHPLVIVDGVEQSIYDAFRLDPQNVESINILKDAAATSVYGLEGANGVIVIKTKRGKKGPAQISASISSGFQKPTLLPDFVGSYRYANLYNKAQLQEGTDPSNLRFSPEAVQAFATGSHPLIYPNTDWVDYLTKSSAFRTKENISVSGGTDELKYYVSGGFTKQDGLFKTFNQTYNYNPSYTKYNLRANLDLDLTPTTRISLTTGGRIGNRIRRRGQYVGWREIYRGAPFAGAGIVDGKIISKGPYGPDQSNRYIPGGKLDPLRFYFGSGYNHYIRNTLDINLDVRQKLDFLTKGLYLNVKGSYNSYYQENKSRTSSFAYYEPYFKTDVDPTVQPGDPGDSTTVLRKIGDEGPLGGSESLSKGRHWLVYGSLHYKRDFGPNNVSGLFLFKQKQTFYPCTVTSNPCNHNGIPRGLTGITGRLNYNYKQRYFIEGSMAYNGSENFAKGKRFGFFPSVAAAWNVTEEPFMKNVHFLDYLKLKASYGVVGNDRGQGRFLYLPTQFTTGAAGYNFGNLVPQSTQGAFEGKLGNPDVHWETSYKQNYGISLRFFNSRLSMDGAYYFEHRTNILTSLSTVPAYVSAELPATNIGVVDNHGIEAKIKWQENLSSDFSYNIQANATFSRNKIVNEDEVHRNYPYQRRTGKPVGQPFGYVFKGFITKDDLKPNSGLPEYSYKLLPGDLKFKDLNGDGVINSDDQRAIGYPEYPEYTFGATVGFHFRNFQVATVWNAAAHVSRNLSFAPYRTGFGVGGGGDWSLLKWQADEAWTPEKGQNAKYPRLSTTVGQRRNNTDASIWLKNGNYIRLKNVVIAYNLKRKLLNNLGLEDVQIYFKGYDLLTFSKIKKFSLDPETKNGNSATTRYPINKVFNFGVNIDF